MKRISRVLGLTLVVFALLAVTFVGLVSAAGSGPVGPAPNSGDGVPDGSGFVAPGGPDAHAGSGSGPVGPAPNSGDGIPDGSGF